MKTSKRTVAAALATIGSIAGSATVQAEPQGYIRDTLDVGFFYGTFEDGPNPFLLVGGSAEEFCLDNPDPFLAEPGEAPLRVFLRDDGAVDLKVNDKGQPIYLYDDIVGPAPVWLAGVCEDVLDGDPETNAPPADAVGTADLKVRISILSDDYVEVFNSVNGTLVGADGANYRVKASADLVVENGVPVGNPADFVKFDLQQIRR